MVHGSANVMANEGVSEGVNKECADQGNVLNDVEHLMGNIDNATPNNVIFIQFNHFMGPKCSKGATIKNFFIVQQEMGGVYFLGIYMVVSRCFVYTLAG